MIMLSMLAMALNQMLCNCALHVIPSIFEGFGMAQVEAMSKGSFFTNSIIA